MFLRVYDVSDLAQTGRDHGYKSDAQPPTEVLAQRVEWREEEGEACFPNPDYPVTHREELRREARRRTNPLNADDLAEAIRSLVEVETWTDKNGKEADAVVFRTGQDGGIKVLGDKILIRQSERGHAKIAELLEMLRQQNAARRTVAIEACWIVADGAGPAAAQDGLTPGVPTRVDLAAMAKVGARIAYQGRLAGLSGQRLHFASGKAQAVVVDAIPVISSEAVAVHPVVRTVQWGAILDICAVPSPSGREAMVDLSSVVTEPTGMRTKRFAVVRETSATATPMDNETLDLLDFVVHQNLATSLTVPLGQTVVIGATPLPKADATSAAKDAPAADAAMMYLVLKVTAGPERPAPRPATQPAAAPKPSPKKPTKGK
jgi:hypothetical protein